MVVFKVPIVRYWTRNSLQELSYCVQDRTERNRIKKSVRLPLALNPRSSKVDVLLDRVCVDLFHKIRCAEHCLRDILPLVLSRCYDMRHRAHSFVLPQCNSNLYKKSFINYCLFKDACMFVACILIN